MYLLLKKKTKKQKAEKNKTKKPPPTKQTKKPPIAELKVCLCKCYVSIYAYVSKASVVSSFVIRALIIVSRREERILNFRATYMDQKHRLVVKYQLK